MDRPAPADGRARPRPSDAGIHYRFDVEAEVRQGRRVGRLVARMEELEGPLLPHVG